MRKLILFLLLLPLLTFSQDFKHQGSVLNSNNVGVSNVPVKLYTKRTSVYSISEPTYSAQPYNVGTIIPSSDDATHGPFNIGFTFKYFNNFYTQFYVGSNGWIGFSPGQTSGYTAAFIPNPGSPTNAILADWEDLLPGSSNIYYQTIGTAPNRRLIVSFFQVPHYGCRTNLHTFQFILYETTNVIDINYLSKPLCSGNNATAGLISTNFSTVVPLGGKNASQWSVSTGETYRFTPAAIDTVWQLTNTQFSSFSGSYLFNGLELDINSFLFMIVAEPPTSINTTSTDWLDLSRVVLGQRQPSSIDYYRYDINNDTTFSVSDLYLQVLKKKWKVPTGKYFTLTNINTIKTSVVDLRSTIPGTTTFTINNPSHNGTTNFYLIRTGYAN
jgi:hypothetical protein